MADGMRTAILNVPRQFTFEPRIQNEEQLRPWHHVIVLGMGGSALAADLLRLWRPTLPITIHNDYGLPALPDAAFSDALVIASSYSGTTEETLDGYAAARERGLHAAAITTGGTLLARAQADGVPYVQLPDTGIQPRMATGFSVLAHLALLRDDEGLHAARRASMLDAPSFEEEGKALAAALQGRMPIMYTASRNRPLAYTWKITFNETAKVPAFANVLPELNHNEMNAFDVVPATRDVADRCHFIFLRDPEDNPRIARRFEILRDLYLQRGLPVEELRLAGRTPFEKVFSSLLVADWAAYHTALLNGVDPERVPMVEEFKKQMIERTMKSEE